MNSLQRLSHSLVGQDNDRRHGGGQHGDGWNRRHRRERDWGWDSFYPIQYTTIPYVYAYPYPYPYYANWPPQIVAAPGGNTIMNQYNPLYAAYYAQLAAQQQQFAQPYNYGLVGQEFPLSVPQLPPPGAMMPFPVNGYVPAGPVVPALSAANLPTRDVLGVVQAVDTPAVALRPVLGIGPHSGLFPGFLSRKKRICGCSCEVVTLRSNLPFRIERLIVEGCDADDFQIEQIVIGQRVLTTGNHGFPAKYLRRGRGGRRGGRGWGCGFNLNVDIDFQHPLRIWVRNKSDETRKFKIFAEGEQLAE